jgi:hypothetical protein
MANLNTFPIYGRNIEYEPGRVMECHAIIGENDVRSLNFLDYWDERVAYDLAESYSRTATEMVLADRAEPVENALVLPAAENVFSFIVDDLGMEPRGRLAYVKEMEGVTTAGLTTYRNLRSVSSRITLCRRRKTILQRL